MDEIKEIPVTSISYRGFEVPIYLDDPGQQFYCYWEGEVLGFGSYNTNYQEDLKFIIDQKLDIIHYFEEPYWGAKLVWFDNGGYRDVKLTYRQRVLKIFVLNDIKVLSESLKIELLKQSREVLDKYLAYQNHKKMIEIFADEV